MVKFLDLQSQYLSIKEDIDYAISSVIESSAFIGGKYLSEFEDQFSMYCDAAHCIGVGNGTDALEIAIEACNFPPGSEIIVPANSFIASSEAVTRTGHKVVFCDVDKDNYVVSVKQLKRHISMNTVAIIAVHLYGHPANMADIMELAKKYNLKVIEDCAQAHGAEFKGKRVGSLGDVAAFSFYPGKNLGAYGDGGCITTNDKVIAEKVRKIANHGRIQKYDHEFEGRNSRLDGLQAAILSVKLKYLENWTDHRIKIADIYCKELANQDGIVLPMKADWAKQVYHLFVIRTKDRDSLKEYLGERGIQTGVHYPVALPKLKAYKGLGQDVKDFFCVNVDSELLSLPIGEHVTERDAMSVANVIANFFKKS